MNIQDLRLNCVQIATLYEKECPNCLLVVANNILEYIMTGEITITEFEDAEFEEEPTVHPMNN